MISTKFLTFYLFILFSCKPNESDILDTINSNDIENLSQYIEKGYLESYIQEGNNAPLNQAISNKNLEIVKMLLDEGFSPNIKTPSGKFLLANSLKAKQFPLAILLIEHNADLDFFIEDDFHVMTWLAHNDYEEVLGKILSMEKFNNFIEDDGFSTLESMVINCSNEIFISALKQSELNEQLIYRLLKTAIWKSQIEKALYIIDNETISTEQDMYFLVSHFWNNNDYILLCESLYRKGISPVGSNAIYEAYAENNNLLYNWLIDHGAVLIEPIPEEFEYMGSPDHL